MRCGLIGKSQALAKVRRLIEKAARHRLPVLLLGETGSGKELVARAIHEAGPRGQFVPIDCGALVGTLMESELFGHVKGAFSGAFENKKGLVEIADGGTAFFDEIGDLPIEMQVKLLRLIQEGEFRAVGSLRWRKVDLRIIAATHRNLRAGIASGRFREDLFYRLNVFTIRLPPLRERMEDVPLLINHFLQGAFEPGADILAALRSYDWPGNVRELKHCIERMVAMQSEGALQAGDLPSQLQQHMGAGAQRNICYITDSIPDEDLPRVTAPHQSPVISVPDSERQAISSALAATNGDRSSAARILKIGRTTLYRKMKEYNLA